MKQLLAVAVAALLVALALVARGALDDDDSDDVTAGGEDGEPADDPGDDGELVIACVTELRDACRALGSDVRIEDPADTIAAAADVDAWVTFDPWPEIAAVAEGRDVFAGEPIPIAASELVLLSRRRSCEAEATWSCVLDAGLAVHAPSTRRALGPLVLAHAGVQLFGGTFARNDLDAGGDLSSSLRRVRLDSPDPVLDMLQLFPAGPAAAGTTSADVAGRVAEAARADEFDVSSGGTTAGVAVVVAGRAAETVADDDALLEALDVAGWNVGSESATEGLPNAGVLFALTEEFR